MSRFEKSLFIKKSLLPSAGKGLYTKEFIKKGALIVEYKGKVTTWENADHDDGKNCYIYYMNKNHVINAKDNKKWLARYANDSKGISTLKDVRNNSTYIIKDKKVYIKAMKDIAPNSEILVGYGKEYWNVIKKYKREEK